MALSFLEAKARKETQPVTELSHPYNQLRPAILMVKSEKNVSYPD